MSFDFRVRCAWRKSRKRKRLIRLLGFEGVVAIEDLWSYCAESRTDGLLTDLSNLDIADEVDWMRDPSELIDALLEVGLITGAGEGFYQVHDWEEHQPWVTKAENRSAAGKKGADARWEKHRKKEKERGDSMLTDANRIENDASRMRTASEIDGNRTKTDAPIRTVPNRTEPSQSEQFKLDHPAPAKPSQPSRAQQVVDYYRKAFDSRVSLKSKTISAKINARLKEGVTVEEMCRAIDGNKADRWHIEAGVHKLEYILQTQSQVEKFCKIAGPGAATVDAGPFSARRFTDLAQRIRLPDPTPELRRAVAAKFTTWEDFEGQVRDCFGAETWGDISKELRIEI